MSIKYLAFFICVLILNINIFQISSFEIKNKNNNKNQNKNKKLSNNNKKNINSNLEKKLDNYTEIWKELFNTQRDSSCKSDNLQSKINKKIKKELSSHGHKSKKGKFAWVKQWGYGKTAYLFDYLDSVLLEDVIKEFNKVYKDMFAINNADTSDYKDPFDIKKLMGTDEKKKEYYIKKMEKINQNYEPKIYEVSVNAVQIHTAMPIWKWEIDVGLKDYAVSFIKKFDMNGDGRLNPRELILGTLEHNNHILGSAECTHCMEGVVGKIDAIFQYLDCDNDGKIISEDIYANLPQIKRSTSLFDIFAVGKSEGIRTDAVNDFILKNSKIEKGALNMKEFRKGILYGIWDRQTDYFKIHDGAERSMKNLRWSKEKIDLKGIKLLKEIKKKEQIRKNMLMKLRSEQNKKILSIK